MRRPAGRSALLGRDEGRVDLGGIDIGQGRCVSYIRVGVRALPIVQGKGKERVSNECYTNYEQ